MNQGLGSDEGLVVQRLDLPMAPSWLPISLGFENKELLDHFIYTASSTLAVFEPNNNEFFSLLVRLALSDNSPSSMAVLQSVLALSSFHRHGLQADVYRFKALALRTLVTSYTPGIDSPIVAQHIAASMVLCHLEMLGMPNNVSLWFCHLSQAKNLIDNAGVDSQYFQREFSGLLGWVEYHMVMGRFTIRHWYIHDMPRKGIKTSAVTDQGTCQLRKFKDVSYCSHEILRLLNFLFEMIQQPTDELYLDDEYEKSLRCLENKINQIVPSASEGTSDIMSQRSTAWAAVIELFKLAALIYMKRASRNFSGISPQIDVMVERAYLLLDDLEAFHPAFPLFIIGCEARKDEQRKKILEHIGRARKTSSLRSLHDLQNILQQIWVQHDLAVDYDMDYLNTLDAVITSYRIMPSFV